MPLPLLAASQLLKMPDRDRPISGYIDSRLSCKEAPYFPFRAKFGRKVLRDHILVVKWVIVNLFLLHKSIKNQKIL
jgi:hypothetical protein